MTVGQKLILGFLVVAALVGIVGYFGIRTLSQLRESSELQTKVDSLLVRISEKGSVAYEMTATQDLEDLAELGRQADALHEEIHILADDLLKAPELKDSSDFQALLETKHDHDKHHEQIFQLRKELLTRQDLFGETYVLERALRYRLRMPIFETNDPQLTRSFGSTEYLSKEAVFQYRDKEHVDEWLRSIDNVMGEAKSGELSLPEKQKEMLLNQLAAYRQTAEIIGQIAIREREIEAEQDQIIPGMRKHEAELATLRNKISDSLTTTIADSSGNSRDILIATIIGTLALAVCIGLFISSSISSPIRKLRSAV